jgi:hypothetical protein
MLPRIQLTILTLKKSSHGVGIVVQFGHYTDVSEKEKRNEKKEFKFLCIISLGANSHYSPPLTLHHIAYKCLLLRSEHFF